MNHSTAYSAKPNFCSRCGEQLQAGVNFCPRCAQPVNPQQTFNYSSAATTASPTRKVSVLLGIGILFIPYIFSWFTLRKGYSNLARIVSMVWLCVVFVSLVSNTRDVARRQATKSESGYQSTSNASTPNTPATWHTVLEVSGKSIKQSETFTITGDEWRISWSAKTRGRGSDIFQIYVYNADGSLKGVAANVQGADDDATIMRGAGTYYLEILNTAQPYGIVVEDKY